MSIPSNIMHFRRERAQELRRYADILEKYIGNGISSKLYQGVTQLKDSSFIPYCRDIEGNSDNRDVNIWGYLINDIELNVLTLEHIRPKGLSVAKAYLNITLVSDYRKWNCMCDPFCELSINVTIKGIIQGSEEGVHYFGFHLDRHHESQKSDEIHPVYHLHYIQNPKDIPDFNYGSTLNIDSPRFTHYPMDIILGLTFLIANFQPNNYQRLINDREFKVLLKEYQATILKPYSHTLSANWIKDSSNINWNPFLLCPYLV